MMSDLQKVKQIANNIKRLRKKKGLTVKELGLESNVNHETISSWSKNTGPADIFLLPLMQISDVLDCKIGDLIDGPQLKLVSDNSEPIDKKLLQQCADMINEAIKEKGIKVKEERWWELVTELYHMQVRSSIDVMANILVN